jgi:hypothetical protein
MSCENFHELIVAELCGEVDSESGELLRDHLENCEACRQTQLEFRALKGMMHQWPAREWNEKLRIRDLVRRNQRWRAIVFSKAALWFMALTAMITVISSLPVRWELSSHQFSLRWGRSSTSDAQITNEMKRLQTQLENLQKQNQQYHQLSEMRIKQMVQQNNLDQQKRYFQTLQLFSNYLQLERKADMQKIQHDIASTYDRTGQQVEKTNELLEYVLRTSAPVDASNDSN